MAAVTTYDSIVQRILALPRPVRIVAIDGPGGSGKSTFARRLADAAGGAQVVPTDDFASWDNPVNWWPRLLEQVLEPLARGEAGRYQRFDWPTNRLAEWIAVEPAPIVVVEGVSSARLEWQHHLSFVVWVDTERETRLRRGLERDGEDQRAQWETWMAAEDDHFAAHRTRERADVIVDGDPAVSHEPVSDVVVLR